jgi:hypothetical protein
MSLGQTLKTYKYSLGVLFDQYPHLLIFFLQTQSDEARLCYSRKLLHPYRHVRIECIFSKHKQEGYMFFSGSFPKVFAKPNHVYGWLWETSIVQIYKFAMHYSKRTTKQHMIEKNTQPGECLFVVCRGSINNSRGLPVFSPSQHKSPLFLSPKTPTKRRHGLRLFLSQKVQSIAKCVSNGSASSKPNSQNSCSLLEHF